MILDLFMELVNGLYKMIIETIFEPFKEIMSLFLATPENINQFQYVTLIFDNAWVVGMALLILFVGWQTFKVMFSYAGFECEDPLKVAVRAIISGFFMYFSKDLIYLILGIFRNIIDFIWTVWGNGNVSDNPSQFISIITGFILNNTGALTLVQMILILYLIYKFINLAFKFAERLILTALLIMGSPLAFACNVSKATEGFFQGWVKLFAGNLIIQVLQLSMFISMSTVIAKNTVDEMVIHLRSDATILVEKHTGGLVNSKFINPDDLFSCIKNSYSHIGIESGILPEIPSFTGRSRTKPAG